MKRESLFGIIFVLCLLSFPDSAHSESEPYTNRLIHEKSPQWKTEKDEISASSESMTRAVRAEAQAKAAMSYALDEKTLERAYQ